MSNDPRQQKLNVRDLMSPSMTLPLPPTPKFDPSDRLGWKHPPPQAVLDLLPDGRRLEKNFKLSAEFTPSIQNSIPPIQRNRLRYNRGWGGRFPGVFQDKNVMFRDNNLILRATMESEPPLEMKTWFPTNLVEGRRKEFKPFFGNSFLRTRDTMTFGYTETLCRLADSAVTCAFWLKELGGTEREIDVFEYTTGRQKGGPQHSREKIHLMTVHQFKSRVTGRHEHLNTYVGFDKNLSKEKFFKAGLLWTPEKIIWFVNDVPVRELVHNGLFGGDCRMHIQFDREIFSWIFEPDEKDRLDDFIIYYLRTWNL